RALPLLKPTKAGRSVAGRNVLASDPTLISQLIDEIEQVRKIHFASVGFVALRHSCNLEMAHASLLRVCKILPNPDRQIAFFHLAMKQVHQDLEIGRADFSHDGVRFFLAIQNESGYV